MRNAYLKLKGRAYACKGALLFLASLVAASCGGGSGGAASFQMVCRYTGEPMVVAQPLLALASHACCRPPSDIATNPAPNKGSALSPSSCCDLKQTPGKADAVALAPDPAQAPVWATLAVVSRAVPPHWTNAPARRYLATTDRGRAPPFAATYAPPRGPPCFS